MYTVDDLKELADKLDAALEKIYQMIGDAEEADAGMKERQDHGKRRRYYPELGDIIENTAGGKYCVTAISICSCQVCNIKSGWTCDVHELGIYEDGKCDWSYSTGGYFDPALLRKVTN